MEVIFQRQEKKKLNDSCEFKCGLIYREINHLYKLNDKFNYGFFTVDPKGKIVTFSIITNSIGINMIWWVSKNFVWPVWGNVVIWYFENYSEIFVCVYAQKDIIPMIRAQKCQCHDNKILFCLLWILNESTERICWIYLKKKVQLNENWWCSAFRSSSDLNWIILLLQILRLL